MALDGSYSILYSFSGGADGYESSYAGLVEVIDSNLYGATSHGGAYGHGTVFKMSPDGTPWFRLMVPTATGSRR